MNIDEFARNRKNCYTSEHGFLFWKISYEGNRGPCRLDGDGSNIIAHLVVVEGEITLLFGDKQYMICKNTLATFLEQNSLEFLSASDNVKAYLVVMCNSYSHELLKYNPPFPFSYVMERRKKPTETVKAEIMRLLSCKMDSIENVCADEKHFFRDEMIKCSLRMLLMDIANVHIRYEEQEKVNGQTERKKELFMRFMQLLSAHVTHERSVDFYASELCITRQYLNRVVKLNSDKTAYEWICFTLTGEITEYLENTCDTMQQVSEHFRFPDQASLAKFFKHQTGYTPTEYKKKLMTK